MIFKPNTPSRKFLVGNNKKFFMEDCGSVHLKPDQQITFKTENGSEYDVAQKNWGFYATPSLNGRLIEFNLKPVLVRNIKTNKYFILLVHKDRDVEFKHYLDEEGLEVILWLNEDTLHTIKQQHSGN